MAYGRTVVLNLYRNLILESRKWKAYNYREYALRKIRHEFRQNQALKDAKLIEDCYKKGLESLDIIKRQVLIGNLYSTRPLVIETKHLDKNKVSTRVK